MSSKAVGWAFEQEVRPPALKLILIVLADHTNHETGACYPRIKTIARQASMSPRNVFRYLPELEALGLLRIQRNFDGKCKRPNSYCLACAPNFRGHDNLTPPPENFVRMSQGVVTLLSQQGTLT